MYFAVTSNGRTASYWLAASLDLHPDISCGHSKQNPPIPDYRGRGSDKTLDQVISDQSEIPAKPLAYYEFMRRFADTPVIGTVHAFGIDQARELKRAGIRTAHMTRHPVVRLSSISDRSAIEAESSTAVYARLRKVVERESSTAAIARLKRAVRGQFGRFPLAELPEDPGLEWFAFVAGCCDVAGEARRLGTTDIILPSERLTSEPDYFAWAVRQLADVTLSDDYLDQVFAIGKLNTLSGLRNTAYSIFKQWPDWKREVFARFAKGAPFRNFERLGYDIEGVLKTRSQVSVEAEAVKLASGKRLVILSGGVVDPETIAPGTTLHAYVPVTGTFLAVSLAGENGKMENDTDLLHTPLRPGSKVARVSFRVPEAGSYLLRVGQYERVLSVAGQKYQLSDHGLLRAEISGVG